MNRCPITYELCGVRRYSEKGLKMLSPKLSHLKDFNFTAEEQRKEAIERADKMSIQGIQPKLSAILSIKNEIFEIADKGGKFILKPQNADFIQVPENEDLTMRMAALVGIEVPLHGMIYCKDDSLTYFIKRFDRVGKSGKIPVEDFAQLSGQSRDTKYNYSMEKIVDLIDMYCTFPVLEKIKLFRLTLFNYLVGNEDMHLKNFSLITEKNVTKISPGYDLLNSTIELSKAAEEIALPLKGKKSNLTKNDLIVYFGKERLSINDQVMDEILNQFKKSIEGWIELIEISFLNDVMKEKYLQLLHSRLTKIGLK
jgi:serine/threonine-protein kinase HipA